MKPKPPLPASLADAESDFQKLKRQAMPAKAEESESNWLVSYADMMTLLVGFFLILLSFSKVDSTVFESVKKEASKVFGGEYKVPFEALSDKIKDAIESQKMGDQVVFKQNDAGVEIAFRGALFFDLGSAELKPEALEMLDKIIPVVSEQAKSFGILIEGHTDNLPIVSKQFSSNWELSSVRACSVLRLFESRGFSRKKLKAVGFADTNPILPNTDGNGQALPANQAQNRRVVLKILKDFES